MSWSHGFPDRNAEKTSPKGMLRLFLLCLASLFFLTACDISITIDDDGGGNNIQGSGHLLTQTYDVADFSAIDVSNALAVEVELDSPQAVEARLDDNLIGDLVVEVRSGTLHLSCFQCDPSDQAVIRVGVRSIKRVVASGATRIHFSKIDAQTFALNLSGASRATFENGSISEMNAIVSGASSLEAAGITVQRLELNLSGASRAEVAVVDKVSGVVSGASTLTLAGNANPTEDLDITGASRVLR